MKQNTDSGTKTRAAMRPAGKEVGLTVCGRFPGKRNRNIFSFHQDSSEMIDLLTISSLFRDGSLFPHLSTTWRGDTDVAILARARVFYLIPLTLRKLRDYAFFFFLWTPSKTAN